MVRKPRCSRSYSGPASHPAAEHFQKNKRKSFTVSPSRMIPRTARYVASHSHRQSSFHIVSSHGASSTTRCLRNGFFPNSTSYFHKREWGRAAVTRPITAANNATDKTTLREGVRISSRLPSGNAECHAASLRETDETEHVLSRFLDPLGLLRPDLAEIEG